MTTHEDYVKGKLDQIVLLSGNREQTHYIRNVCNDILLAISRVEVQHVFVLSGLEEKMKKIRQAIDEYYKKYDHEAPHREKQIYAEDLIEELDDIVPDIFVYNKMTKGRAK